MGAEERTFTFDTTARDLTITTIQVHSCRGGEANSRKRTDDHFVIMKTATFSICQEEFRNFWKISVSAISIGKQKCHRQPFYRPQQLSFAFFSRCLWMAIDSAALVLNADSHQWNDHFIYMGELKQ